MGETMIQQVHNETQQDGDNDGGTKGINASHPNHAQLANPAPARLNAVEYHLSRRLRPVRFPICRVDGRNAGIAGYVMGNAVGVVAVGVGQQLSAELCGIELCLDQMQHFWQMICNSQSYLIRIDDPVNVQDAHHDTDHQNVRQGPLAETGQPVQDGSAGRRAETKEPRKVQENEFQVRPNSGKQGQQDRCDARQGRSRHARRGPQFSNGKGIGKGLNRGLIVTCQIQFVGKAQRVVGPFCLGTRGIPP